MWMKRGLILFFVIVAVSAFFVASQGMTELRIGLDYPADGAVFSGGKVSFKANVEIKEFSEPGETLIPGEGWTSATEQPEPIGNPNDPGYDAKAIARWDVVPYQTFDDVFEIGVVAFHMNGIDRIEFSVDDGPWVSVREMTLNPRTGIVEYWAKLDASLFSEDGPVEVRAIAYPNIGVPRVLADEISSENVANGEHSMILYVGKKGSERIYVSVLGSDENPGTEELPVATIERALNIIKSNETEWVNGGEIIFLESGQYEGPRRSAGHTVIQNNQWITMRPKDNLSRDDVVIFRHTGPIRPGVSRLKWESVSVDFNSTSYYQIYGHRHWFDDARWFNSEGWEKNVGHPFHPIGFYFVTDSTAEETLYGFAGATLARNCRDRKISGDVYQNVRSLFDCAIDVVDGSLLGHHTDIYQMWGDMDNTIVYGLHATNIIAQSIFLQPMHPAAVAQNKSNSLRNTAFVNVQIYNEPVYSGRTNTGGPYFSQMQANFSHVLFENVHLPNQRMILRDGGGPWNGKNVIFRNSTLHARTYDDYCLGTSPEGSFFEDCIRSEGNDIPLEYPNFASPCIDENPAAIFYMMDRKVGGYRFLKNLSGYENFNIRLDARPSVGCGSEIQSYEWYLGNGTTISSPEPVLDNILEGGNYTIRLTVTDSLGKSSSVSRDLVVNRLYEPDMLLYLPFDGNANDISMRNNHGNWSGNESYGQGFMGSAALFEADQSVVNIGSSQLVGLNEMTISVLAKKNSSGSGGSGGGRLINRYATYEIRTSGSSYYFMVANETGSIVISGDLETINNDEWHHYTITYDGSDVKAFINGEIVGSEEMTGHTRIGSGWGFRIGLKSFPSSSDKSFNGLIDEVKMYNRALSQQEIAEMY
jgi:hypothetical protein